MVLAFLHHHTVHFQFGVVDMRTNESFDSFAKAGVVDYTEYNVIVGTSNLANGDLQCTSNTCKFKGCEKGYHRLSVNKPTAKNAK